MLWVGGGIVLHGLEVLGLGAPAHLAHDLQHAVEGATGALSGILGWATYAASAALFGLMLGGVIVFILHKVIGLKHEPGAH
jgi:hypothetical protein